MQSIMMTAPNLRSAANYSSFHPQALACHTTPTGATTTTSSSSKGTLAALASSHHGIIVFSTNVPYEPLVVLHHSSSTTATGIDSVAQDRITNLQFQPSNLNEKVYIAASKGRGVMVWDASGNSLSPLLGRVSHPSNVSSLSWCGRNSNTSNNGTSTYDCDGLISTCREWLGRWDLRDSTLRTRPSLRIPSERQDSRAGTFFVSAEYSTIHPHEIATLDSCGVVTIFDDRKTSSSSMKPLCSFNGHASGGINIRSFPSIGSAHHVTHQRWCTWGFEDDDRPCVKIWSPSTSTSSGEQISKDPISGFQDESVYKCTSMTSVPNLSCTRVCPHPFGDAFITISAPKEGSVVSSQWKADLWVVDTGATCTVESQSYNNDNKNFGVQCVSSFQSGGGSEDQVLRQMVGDEREVGHLIAAELAVGHGIHSRQDTSSEGYSDTDAGGKEDHELLICGLTDKGYMTFHAVPETFSIPRHISPQDDENIDEIKGDSRVEEQKEQHQTINISASATIIDNSHHHHQHHTNRHFTIGRQRGYTADDTVLPRIYRQHNSNPSLVDMGRERGGSEVSPRLLREDRLRGLSDTNLPFLSKDGVGGASLQFDLVGLDDRFNHKDTDDVHNINDDIRNMASDDDDDELIHYIPDKPIDPMKAVHVPCPRPCGASFGSFGSGAGGLMIFNNCDIKKTWSWFQSDLYRSRVNMNSGVLLSNEIAANTLEDIANLGTGEESKIATPESFLEYPRTLLDLMRMKKAAEVADRGNEEDEDSASDSDSGDFSSSDELSSDDSYVNVHDEKLTHDLNTMKKSREDVMYENYFGTVSSSLGLLAESANKSLQNIEKRKTIRSRNESSTSAGPTVDSKPVVCFVNKHHLIFNGQCIELAKNWMLGSWSQQRYCGDTSIGENNECFLATDVQQPNNNYYISESTSDEDPTAMSSKYLEEEKTSFPPIQQGKNEMSMIGNIRKLLHHPTTRNISSIPVDQKVMEKKSLDLEHFENIVDDPKIEFVVNAPSPEMKAIGCDLALFNQVKSNCIHNAEVSSRHGQSKKAEVWHLLAQVIDNISSGICDEFDGWQGLNGALGRDLVKNIMQYYESQGDVQMLATIVCVLGGARRRRNINEHDGRSKSPLDILPCDKATCDAYISLYSSLLFGWSALTIRTELNKHLNSHIESGSASTMNSNLGISPVSTVRCSLCTNIVRGLVSICSKCGHGGHYSCMMSWFKNNSICPTGCGCSCTFTNMFTESDGRHRTRARSQDMNDSIAGDMGYTFV